MTRYATNAHRRELLDGLLNALRSLKAAGCRVAYLDGSFVTAKELPSCSTSATAAPHRRPAAAASCSRPRPPPRRQGPPFLDYFRRDRDTGQPKGIIAIDLGALP